MIFRTILIENGAKTFDQREKTLLGFLKIQIKENDSLLVIVKGAFII
jgi:hypothetical protein